MHQTFNLVKKGRYLPGLPITNMNEEHLHQVQFEHHGIWVPESWHELEIRALRRAGFVLQHIHDHVRVIFSDGTILEDFEFRG